MQYAITTILCATAIHRRAQPAPGLDAVEEGSQVSPFTGEAAHADCVRIRRKYLLPFLSAAQLLARAFAASRTHPAQLAQWSASGNTDMSGPISAIRCHAAIFSTPGIVANASTRSAYGLHPRDLSLHSSTAG